MKYYIFKVLVWLVVKTHIYMLWSRVFRFLTKKQRDSSIPEIPGLYTLELLFAKSKWRADKWWMLWDVVSHPEYAWHEFKTTGSFGDCDDYASFACEVLQRYANIDNPAILSAQWLDKDNKFHGHNVCLFQYGINARYSYVGNWFNGRAIHNLESIDSVVSHIINQSGGGRLISWFVFTHDTLKIKETIYEYRR